MAEFPSTFASTSWLRLERLMLLARYDQGAMAPAIFGILKQTEVEISWREHAQFLRSPS